MMLRQIRRLQQTPLSYNPLFATSSLLTTSTVDGTSSGNGLSTNSSTTTTSTTTPASSFTTGCPQLLTHHFHTQRRTFGTNKAAGHRNVGRTIQNRVVAPEKWHHIDARGKVVGRLATEIVTLLTGKHKPTYLPNIDSGDHVVVTNARHIVMTGKKVDDKLYRWHTGYPGGLKQKTVKETLATKPDDVLRKAVNGMLPKNRLRKLRMRKFRTYNDEDHPHKAQLAGKLKA